MLIKPSSCSGCPLHSGEYGKPFGYVPQEGTGDNGVLVVLEAAGEDEEACGRPTVGRAGQYLWSSLQRVGIERAGFRIHNVLSCRPPNNKLIKMPYTDAAIVHCSPNLEKTVSEHIAHAKEAGKTPVIVALGKFAFRQLMNLTDRDAIMRADYQTYPHWSGRYGCWIMAAPHPSHIMQGKHNLAPTLQYVFQRALEVASDGIEMDKPFYLLDPPAEDFHRWTNEYLAKVAADTKSVFLSYDIETPYKSGKDEAEVAREDDDDYTILRCSFCYAPGNAVSVPWTPEYMEDIKRIFQSGGYGVNWNGTVYDDARISQYLTFNMVRLDAMLAWHVLNTALPKGLGFVTPFYWKNTAMWKHLSDAMPAFYNAKDSDAALRCFLGIRKDLETNGLWAVFDRHVVRLNEVLAFMSREGVLLDSAARQEAETRLAALLVEIDARMQAAVPSEARKLHVYKKTPKVVEGLVQTEGLRSTKQCSHCGLLDVSAKHFKSVGRKQLDTCHCGKPRKAHCDLDEPALDHPAGCRKQHHEFRGGVEQPCHGAKAVKTTVPALLYAKPLVFKISKIGLESYQKVMGHKAIINRKEHKVTFDINAIKSLIRNYPEDPVYPVIGEFRKVQKLLGTYVGVTDVETKRVRGGMPIGRDGKVHTIYVHNPSTLRLASQQPNMQNLPRPSKNKADLANLIRNLIIPEAGTTFIARDFSGIEAVLVGYDAKDPDYIRLARRDVHSFYTAYALNQLDGRVKANDLPLLAWDDDKLFTRLGEIKHEFKEDRNSLYKHLVHAINFGQGPKGAQEKIYKETGIVFPVALIGRLMDIYKELFPRIPRWQTSVRQKAHTDGHLRNAFGYVHRFNHVFANRMKNGAWEQIPGDDAEAVLAFKPQSNAAGIMKESLIEFYFNRFEEIGQYLRMTIHDECFFQCPLDKVEQVDRLSQEVMEAPVQQLPLDPAWKMGSHLVVLTESKVGSRWGEMH